MYNLYYTAVGQAPYKIPGPTVWSGAAPSVANPALGAKKGSTTVGRWSTWVGTDRVVTVVGADGATTKSPYKPTWPSKLPKKAPKETTTQILTSSTQGTYVTPTRPPSSVVPASSSTPTPTQPPNSTTPPITSAPAPSTTAQSGSGNAQWAQCGGIGYTGATGCQSPFSCQKVNGK